MTLAIALLSLAAVLAVGLGARRLGGRDEFFLAGRTIGPVLLLLTLFGTHMTSFALLGAAAESYRRGIGVFALMASSSALVVPLVFLFVGLPLWREAKAHGYLTPVGWLRTRFQSEAFGFALVAVFAALLVPYLLVGIIGAGVTLEQASGGRLTEAAGGFVVVAVVAAYVTSGGMRATAWVNALQTLFFSSLGALAVWIVLRDFGGPAAAMTRLVGERPDLAVRGSAMGPWEVATWAFVPLSAATFPHLAIHWMSARSAATFRLPVVVYPLLIAIVWFPSVVLGLLAALEIPGLEGRATNGVLVNLLANHAGDWLAGLLFAGVLAAVMSSLDSQSLALGALFTHDVVGRLGKAIDESRQVLYGRLGVVVTLLIAWSLSLLHPPGIFRLGAWAFAGFASLAPIVVGALHWPRTSRAGAWAALITGVAGWCWLFFGGHDAIGAARIQPAAVLVAATTVALVVGSILSPTKPAAANR